MKDLSAHRLENSIWGYIQARKSPEYSFKINQRNHTDKTHMWTTWTALNKCKSSEAVILMAQALKDQ